VHLALKALVTGGAGFIGSHLVDRLMENDFEVTVLDNFSTGSLKNLSQHLGKANFHLIDGDIRSERDVKKALEDIDFVFHLAAIVSVELSIKNPILVNEVNVCGTLNLLEESLNSGVKRFVYISSCAVYGNPTRLPIDEEHPTKPTSPYGASKLASENYCRIFHEIYGLQTVSLRLFNVYGSRQAMGPYSGVITKFIDRLKHGKPPIIYGDGEQTRDFIFVDDVVDACLHAINCKNCVGESINVGSGVETSINELARTISSLFGMQKIKPIYTKPRIGEVRHSCADISKAEKLLGLKPKISLEEGLRKLVAGTCAK